MEIVILIVMLALAEYYFFGIQLGNARNRYGIRAPATTGHPVFERYFRVQQNTLEQLIAFIPAIFSFAWTAENIGWPGNYIAAGLGVIWLIGRFIYADSYVKDPANRSLGFGLTALPTMLMIAGTIICILISLL